MKMRRWICSLAILLSAMMYAQQSAAQDLTTSIEDVFSDVLEVNLAGSPGAHGGHFKPDNVATSGKIISALSSFISTNTSTFPLSTSSTGLTFDFSGAVPVAIANSAILAVGWLAEHVAISAGFSLLAGILAVALVVFLIYRHTIPMSQPGATSQDGVSTE